MNVAVIGAGHIGGNIARQATRAGHDVKLSFSRDPISLDRLAHELGAHGSAGTPREAVEFGDVVVLSVPWGLIPQALGEAGDLHGKIVVDTTNQFGSGPLPSAGQTAASFNAERMPGARYVKSFNTLTASFQAETASRRGDERIVQWICGDDRSAKEVVAGLIDEMSYVPIDVGGTRTCDVMEAPRRDGAVYGEEYRAADARAVVAALRGGVAIPPTPQYE
jgi:predicted dinucleotide-binding enzyme